MKIVLLTFSFSFSDFGRNIFDESSKFTVDFEEKCQKYVKNTCKMFI